MNTVQILGKLAMAFPQPPIDPRTLAVYAEALSGASKEELIEAVQELIATSKHFPRVADLLENIRGRRKRVLSSEERAARLKQLCEPRNAHPTSLREAFLAFRRNEEARYRSDAGL